MTIEKRFRLTGLIPILLLFLLSGYFLVTSYINYEKASAFKNRLENNALLTDILVKIGKERSVTAPYLASDKKKYLSSLSKQRKILDESYQNLETKLHKKIAPYIPQLLELVDPLLSQKSIHYDTLLNNLALIPTIRKTVDSKEFNFKKIFFNLYTDLLAAPILESIKRLYYYPITPEITSLVDTLLALHTAQEYTSLERGFISYFLEKKSTMTFEDMLQWESFESKSNSYTVFQLSPETLKHTITQILADKNAQALFKNIIRARTSIKLHVSNGNYTQDTIDWFTLQSNKITLLTKAQLLISNTLWTKINTILKTHLFLLILSALVLLFALFLAYVGYRTQKDISNNIYSLGEMLNHATYNMRHTDPALNRELETVKNINLNTTKGTKKAYRFLQMLIETTHADRPVAVSTDETKSRFLEHMSHEIRTPLNNIVGFTQILRDTNLDETQSEFVSIIDKSSENILHTINNVLDFSKIENRKMEIKNIVFDADKAFENTIETCAVEAAEKNINLYYYMDPSISKQLKGDPYKIKEVLINFLSNAIKFTQRAGEINLNITKDEPHYITFTIEDNAISQDKQTDSSMVKKYAGTDFELTIVCKFVEMMYGNLTVNNNQGEGKIFSFTLPLEEISTEETMSNSHNGDLTIGLCTNNISSKFKSNLTHYFNDIKANIQEFDSLKQLQILEESQSCQYYWIDIDKVDQDILNYMHTINKSKLIILAYVTSRDKINTLGLEQNTIVYKPLTFSKVRKHLNYGNHITTSSIIKKSTPSEEETVKKTHKSPSKLFNVGVPTGIIETEDRLPKKILIAKKLLLERRVLITVIENIGLEYEILADSDLEAMLKSNKYDIVFSDDVSDEIQTLYPTVSIITKAKTKDEILALVSKKRG